MRWVLAACPGRGFGAIAVVWLALLGLSAAPAHALGPPEVFLKEVDESNLPTGSWIPLTGARMQSVNRYEVGVRVQDSGTSGNRQRILVQVTSVPDGHPDQKNVYPLCVFVSGAAGQIADVDEQVLYEGDGRYSLSVTASTGTDESTDCTSGGPTTATGSFTASAPTSLRFVGRLTFLDPSQPRGFNGLRIFPAFGAGETEVICARDPKRRPDGTLTGSVAFDRDLDGYEANPNRVSTDELFKKPGNWGCVGRSRGGGVTPGPWSAPTPTEPVREGVYAHWRLTSTRGPNVTVIARLQPAESAGGSFSVLIRSARGAPMHLRGRVGRGGRAVLRFRMPPIGDTGMGGVVAYVSFGGTRFAEPRRSFYGFALESFARAGGGMTVEFGSSCATPTSC